MADSTRIEEIISERAVKAFDDLKLKVDASAASVEALVKRAVELNSALGGVKSPKDFNKSIQDIDAAERNLLNTVRSLNAEQAKLNDASALQARKVAIQDEILAQKQLQTQIKANALEKQNQAAADKAAAAQRKVDLANENAAQQERNELLRQEQAEKAKLTQQTEALDRAEEARLTNAATARSGVSGQESGTKNNNTPFVASSELQKSAALVKSYEASLTRVRTEQTKLNTQLKAGTITQGEYDARLNKLIIDENKFKAALSEAQKALTLQNKANEFAKGSLEQRRIALDRLNKSYALLNTTERASAGGQRQLKIIQDLTSQVTLLETSVGKSQRAVGGYGNAITKAFGNAFGVVRQLAYVLPGIGIAGILGALIDPLANLISKLFETNSAFKDTQTSLDGAKDSFASAAAQVDLLKINISLAKDGFLDKDKVLKQYNETIGKTTGEVKSLQEAEDALNKNAEAYIKFTFLKAAATVALGKAGELAVQAELDNQQELEKIRKINQAPDRRADQDAGAAGLSEFLQKGVDNERKATERANKKRVDQLRKIGADFEKQAAEISKNFNFDFFGGTEDDKTGKADRDSTKIRAMTKKFFDDQLKDQVSALKQLSQNQEFYLTDRLGKRKQAFDIEQSLIRQQASVELKNERDKLNASLQAEAEKDLAKANSKDPSKVQGGSQNARINAQNEFNEKVFEINQKSAYDLEKLETTLGGDLLQIRNTFNLKRRTEDAKDYADAITQFNKFAEDRKRAELAAVNSRSEREIDSIARDTDEQLRVINDSANKKIEAAGGNTEKIARIEKKAAQDSLEVTIRAERLRLRVILNSQKALLAIAQTDKNFGDIEKTKAKIAEIEKALSDLDSKSLKLKLDVDTTGIDKFLSVLDKIKEKTMQVFDLIGGAVNASTIAQKNALQDQSDELERRAQKDIDTINASADSEEKKAARVQLVTAQTQAQKEVIAQRQRQLDQRQAEVDKARTIASIILDTAGAVARQIKLTPLPLGLPFVAAVAALGAAQLAVAIATPIPRFEDGTMDAPGGLAQVNEKRKELVITPDGRLIETPGTPVVMNIPKHSIVLPDSRAVMERGIGRRELGQIRERNPEVAEVLGRKLDNLTRVIKNKTENHWQRKGDGWDLIKKSGNNTTRYL